jgi:hypothetical protein
VNPSPAAERRQGKRSRARLAIRLWNDRQECRGHTLDLSSSGMFVETAAPLEIGTRMHFEIQHALGPFFGEALVVRKKRVPPNLRTIVKPGVGLKLVALTSLLSRDAAEADPEPAAALTDLQIDLSDPTQLASVHRGELRGGVLFVPCTSPPEVAASVRIHVQLPPPYAPLTWRGQVVQRSEQPCGAAIELADRVQIATLVSEILGALGA